MNAKTMKHIRKKWGFDYIYNIPEIITSINYFLENPPTYTILNSGTLSNHAISFLMDNFDRGYPLQEAFDVQIENMIIKGNIWDFLENPLNAKKDEVWGKQRNKSLVQELYYKFDYTPGLQKRIIAVLADLKSDIDAFQKLQKAHDDAWKAERLRARKEFKMEIVTVRKGCGGEGGVDPHAIVRLTKGGISRKYHCRNIFDFGFVVNPDIPGGGILLRLENGQWAWDRKKGYKIADEFDVSAVTYLRRFSPISTEIRM